MLCLESLFCEPDHTVVPGTCGASGNEERRAVMAEGTVSEGRISHRGFASMNAERQRQIASMGGKAVPDEKRSFSQNRRLAAEAGRKGGQSVPGAKRSFSQNRALAAIAGRKGGQSVPDEKRSFSQHPELAAEAGRKGGQASHGGGTRPS
jgi:general stress protein YciG